MKYIFISILFIAFSVSATKWMESSIGDPIKLDSVCSVNQILSSGSYVFDWPSKYDQIFFPYTSSASIWFCKDSGYISFMGDFDNITAEEKINITNYLGSHPQKNIRTLLSKLKLLEKTYTLRELPPEISNKNKRILAYLYEKLEKFEYANDLRKSALVEIYVLLKTDLTQYKRLEYLYIAANYERQLGNVVNSDIRLKILKKEIDNIQAEELKGFGNYLSKLSSDTLRIEAGGKLEPLVEKAEPPQAVNKIDTWITNSSVVCRTEIQTFYQNIKPLFKDYQNQIIVDKGISELLNIRDILIDTGNISSQTIKAYSSYNDLGNTFNNEVNSFKAKGTVLCSSEINNFSEKLLSDFHQHMVLVVNDVATDLVSVKNVLLEKDTAEGRKAIDLLLLENSLSKLYCYVRDYDVSEHELCPTKSLPYKDTFKKLKTNLEKTPLRVDDEMAVEKLRKGFSSLGI
ncbi:MAG: hypothetical protein WBC60_12330 [Cognaticolwellia sp.]